MPANKKWLFRNNARSTLKNAILGTDLQFQVNTGDGDLYFPSPVAANNEAFRVTLIDANGNIEIVECTGRAVGTDVFNPVARGMEGTIPLAFAAGSRVSMRVTQAQLESLRDQWLTGDYRMTLRNVAAPGWLLCNDGTIGSAASGATYAAADALPLYTLLWNNVSNANCPVAGGRGVSAAADFAANKTLALTKTLGRALSVAGAGAGLTARNLGDAIGEETHLLTNAEVPATPVTITDPGHHHLTSINGAGPTTGAAFGILNIQANGVTETPITSTNTTGVTAVVAGGGLAHNNLGPETFGNLEIHL